MTGPEVIYRYNRFRTAKIVGQNAIGYSSGQSATAMDQIGERNLPTGFGLRMDGDGFPAEAFRGQRGISVWLRGRDGVPVPGGVV